MNERKLAKEIKRIVDSKGLKQKHLAEVIGVHKGTLNQFLNGKRPLGRAAFLSLLRELRIEEEALVGRAS